MADKSPELGVFHIEFREALEHGELLSDRGFSLGPVESPQIKMDEFMEDHEE